MFGKLRSSKIRFPNGEKKKILTYDLSNSWFTLYDGQLEDKGEDKSFQMELTFPIPESRIHNTKMISYTGVITKVLDAAYRFFEIDEKHQLFLGYCQEHVMNLVNVGTCITINHAHIFSISDAVIFIGCYYSTVVVNSLTSFNNSTSLSRRKVLMKYPCIRDYLISRHLKSALGIVFGDKSPDFSPILDDIKSLLEANTTNRMKEPSLFDFMAHNVFEECRVTKGHDKLPKFLTPAELLDLVQNKGLELDPQKSYNYLAVSHDELGFDHVFLLGILDSNETGVLRLRDSLGHCVTCTINPESKSQLSLKNFRQLSLFSEFEIIIEQYGFASLEEVTQKIYIRINLDSVHFWDIFAKSALPAPYNYAFKICYMRPIIWDLNPLNKTLSSCTLEGIGWHFDKMQQVKMPENRIWIKLSGLATSLVPFLKKEKLYYIYGESTNSDRHTDRSDIFIPIDQESYIIESEMQNLIRSDDSVYSELPVISLQTFVLGYKSLEFASGLTEDLISMRARIISKDTTSSEPWDSPCRLSSKELSTTWNLGIGFSDRICILHLQDEFSHERFSIYYDCRTLALQYDLLPGALVQFIRLGIQVSKGRKLYGVVLPITSIEIKSISAPNPEICLSSYDKPAPLLKLCDLNQFSPLCRVVCSISQIISISLKRQNRLEDSKQGNSEICCTATLKLEDGTAEASAHINSVELLFSILSLTSEQKSTLFENIKRQGEITFSFDIEKGPSSNVILRKLAISACSPSLIVLRVKFKYLGSEYRLRTISSKNDSVQVACPPTLSLQVEGFELFDSLCILHQQLQQLKAD